MNKFIEMIVESMKDNERLYSDSPETEYKLEESSDLTPSPETFETLKLCVFGMAYMYDVRWSEYGSIPSYCKSSIKQIVQNLKKELAIDRVADIKSLEFTPEMFKKLSSKFSDMVNEIRMYVQDGDIDDNFTAKEIVNYTNAYADVLNYTSLMDFELDGQHIEIPQRLKDRILDPIMYTEQDNGNVDGNKDVVSEVSRTSLNGAIINRKFSPAVFRNPTYQKLNLQCHIVTPGDVAAKFGKNGIKAEFFPDGEIALIQYKYIGKDISQEIMKFFNDTCGSDLGKRFEKPMDDYLVLGEVPFTPRGGHPEPYTGIAIPLTGKVNVSDDVAAQASKTRALGNYGNESDKKKIEQIFVTSFNKMRGQTEKSYNLMCYSKNNSHTKDKVVLFFACDQVPTGDTLVRTDIVKILNRILAENTQIKEIYKNSALTEDDIARYGDVETKNGPKTVFYIFMNMSGSAVDIDECDKTDEISKLYETESAEQQYKALEKFFEGVFDADGQVYAEYKPEQNAVICHLYIDQYATPAEHDTEKSELWEVINDYLENYNAKNHTQFVLSQSMDTEDYFVIKLGADASEIDEAQIDHLIKWAQGKYPDKTPEEHRKIAQSIIDRQAQKRNSTDDVTIKPKTQTTKLPELMNNREISEMFSALDKIMEENSYRSWLSRNSEDYIDRKSWKYDKVGAQARADVENKKWESSDKRLEGLRATYNDAKNKATSKINEIVGAFGTFNFNTGKSTISTLNTHIQHFSFYRVYEEPGKANVIMRSDGYVPEVLQKVFSTKEESVAAWGEYLKTFPKSNISKK